MNRETQTIITPQGNHTVVLKTYLTGREKRALQNALLNTGTLQFNTVTKKIEGITGEIADKEQDTLIAMLIESVDGKTEGILDMVLDMRGIDYEFIVAKINEVKGGPVDTEEKKTV